MIDVSTFGLVLHHDRQEALELARDVSSWLTERDHSVRLPEADAERCGLGEFAVADTAFAAGLDAVVSLGGDGTILRTVALLGGAEVPIIGVNLGQLGYLTEVEPTGVHEALDAFLKGAYTVEKRMLLAVGIDSSAVSTDAQVALNEAVLEKTLSGHTVRLDVLIDGRPFTPYETDGLIIATPTGSTAYAFSVRSPIIAPTHRAIMLAPVSPHMLFDRTLVLEPDSMVEVRVAGHRPATLTIDGRVAGELAVGDAIRCTASPHSVHLAMFSPRDFTGILKSKFGLSDR
ncbi:MAG: NAD(+)/NADH kinase [Acidimicrobiales bacterium]|nr:NAD(+)/NADH kinase [Acidimicrobiales bacterium]